MKNNKGFSLVELIVVIAIMAILAAVAVIGVSVYIPKAQQANDKQLISDIEYALTLAGYNGDFEEGQGGYIILTTEGVSNADDIKQNNPKLAQVLANVYGENWDTEMKLAYDEWGNNGLLTNFDADQAKIVSDSSFLTGNRADKLLTDVEKMTKMATNLTSMIDSNATVAGESLSAMFTTKDNVCAIDAVAKKHGITKGEETWEQWATKDNGKNQAAYSNLLVLTAAEESAKNAADDTYEMSDASKLIMNFSSYYAFAAKNSDFSVEFDKQMDELKDVTDFSTGKDWYIELLGMAEGYGYDDYENSTEDFENKLAFSTIMASVSNSTNAEAGNIDLNDANLFTEGSVNDMYNDYLTNIDAMKGFFVQDSENPVTIDLEVGQVAVLFVYKDGQTFSTQSLPTE